MQFILWAELTRGPLRIWVGSNDWQFIMFRAPDLTVGNARWDGDEGVYHCSAVDAKKLADVLAAGGYSACRGSVGHIETGPLISSTLVGLDYADGLDVRERTRRLAEFLRGGPYAWRFVQRVYETPEDLRVEPANARSERPWVIETCREEPHTDRPEETATRFYEIPVENQDEGEWSREFWGLFPDSPDAFTEVAKKPGIHAWIPLEFSPSVDFATDEVRWRSEYDEALAAAQRRLPDPPYGFEWHEDVGGAILGQNARGRMVPMSIHYRLWRSDLGYMPRSE